MFKRNVARIESIYTVSQPLARHVAKVASNNMSRPSLGINKADTVACELVENDSFR